MSKQQNQNGQVPQMPEVRNVPTWDKEADIVLKGYEWEVIFNGIANLQVLAQAASSVMSRNIVNGVINMDFQKLDPASLQYTDMTPEEKEPYVNDFNKILDQMRNPKQPVEQSAIETQTVATPREEIVDPEETEGGKVVSMFEDSKPEAPAPDFAVE